MSNYLDDYQKWSRTTAIYPKDQAINYLALGLAPESGEVAGKIKKAIRDGTFNRADIISELSDIAWYLARLSDELEVPLLTVFDTNFHKLEDRKARGVLGGSGDKR